MSRTRYILPLAIAAWVAIVGTVYAVTGTRLPVEEWKTATAGYRSALGQKPKVPVKTYAIGRLIR